MHVRIVARIYVCSIFNVFSKLKKVAYQCLHKSFMKLNEEKLRQKWSTHTECYYNIFSVKSFSLSYPILWDECGRRRRPSGDFSSSSRRANGRWSAGNRRPRPASECTCSRRSSPSALRRRFSPSIGVRASSTCTSPAKKSENVDYCWKLTHTWLHRLRGRILFLSFRWMVRRFLPGSVQINRPPYGVMHFFGGFTRIVIWCTALDEMIC